MRTFNPPIGTHYIAGVDRFYIDSTSSNITIPNTKANDLIEIVLYSVIGLSGWTYVRLVFTTPTSNCYFCSHLTSQRVGIPIYSTGEARGSDHIEVKILDNNTAIINVATTTDGTISSVGIYGSYHILRPY